jgi:tetratricopeptide (TPR) repeat protein
MVVRLNEMLFPTSNGDAASLASRGLELRLMGDIDAAVEAFTQALAIEPKEVRLYSLLFRSKKAVVGDPQLAALFDLANCIESLPREDQIYLHFTLGKVFADLQQYDRSFKHLLEGNALKRREINYNERAMLNGFDRIREVFTPRIMQDSKYGNPSTKPVFILGMPRSGSTLVEQILASHSQVFAAGEINAFSRAALASGLLDAEFPENARTLSAGRISEIGTRYIFEIDKISQTAKCVINKMPSNFRLAGLICLSLPNVRIIHTRRDPVDTCISCFSTLFEHRNLFSYDLGELGRYYRAYEKMMEHWQTVLPDGTMIEVKYEELVADFETQARRLVSHCGLQWQDSCLNFYKTRRLVRTELGVHQPLYSTSVGRGNSYAGKLQPLLDGLGAF